MTKLAILGLTLACAALAMAADTQHHKTFAHHTVHYSAFNSSFVLPEIASAYNITRGKDRGLVNVALIEEGRSGGLPAKVEGTYANMLAQQRTLEFVEVREENAVYYLAPFKFENEDSLTFKIKVTPATETQAINPAPAGQPPYELSFQRKFYRDK